MFGKNSFLRKIATTVDHPAKPYVRLATPEDHEQILDVAKDACAHDPAMLYIGGVKPDEVTEHGLSAKKEAHLRQFIALLLKATLTLNGRVTVVCDPTETAGAIRDNIVAAAFWLPPHNRIKLYYGRLLLRSGIIGVIKAWGLNGLRRAALEWMDVAHSGLANGFKDKGIHQAADDSWHLLYAMTHPDHENKGHMSLLLRDGFANAPDDAYTLNATTKKSRDRYLHHGYDLLSTFKIGEGKVSSNGLPAKGKSAEGVEIYIMVKWAQGSVLLT